MPPVRFDVLDRPARYDRVQVLLRVLILMFLGALGTPLGWVFGVLYLGLPVAAAVVIASSGAARWRDDAGPTLYRAMRWLVAFYAYLALLTDRFPTREAQLGVRYEVDPTDEPTPGSALMRLLSSIPAAIVMWLLGIVAGFLWIVGAVLILINTTLPAAIFDFLRGLMRMFARFLGHHASLVAGAAPIAFDTGEEVAPPPATVVRPAPRAVAPPMPPAPPTTSGA